MPYRVSSPVLFIAALVMYLVLTPGTSFSLASENTSSSSPASAPYPPTGYFSVAQKAGGSGWTLVTPQGQPFYASGIDTVAPNGSGTDQVTGICPYCQTVANDFPNTAAWATSTVAELRSWGFNTLGTFSDDADLGSQMPYEMQLSMASGSDWFAPSFVTHADQVAATQVAPVANDPNLIGYFTDTELGWGPLTGNGVGNDDTPLAQYLQLPPGSPGLAVAQQYIGNPTGFMSVLATRYFSVTNAAIRMYDPNHLILGAKAEGAEVEPALVKAAAPYVNVFSIDYYQLAPNFDQAVDSIWPPYLPMEQNLANIEAAANVPLMIGEYSFMTPSPSDPNTADPWYLTATTQQQRASQFENYIAPLYEDTPNLVGDDWFQFVDEPANGRAGDGENSDFGMVNVNGVPYPPLVSAMQLMHGVVADENGDNGPVCDSWAAGGSGVTCTANMPTPTASPLTIVTTSLPTGYVDTSYNYLDGGVYAAGGTPGYTYSVTQGSLPGGLTLDPTTGIISGSPSSAGTWSFTVQASDSGGSPPVTQALSLTVDPEFPLSLSAIPYPTASQGQYYQVVLGATGGAWPRTWTITQGAVPPGLNFSSSGVINGIPTESGSFSFTVQVADSSNTQQTATATFTLNVAPTTSLVLPPANATLQGSALLDASASSINGIRSVQFEISGGTIHDEILGTATATFYGELYLFDTTAFPNGTYTIQSIATDTHGLATTSAPQTITIQNPPSTTVLAPSPSSTLQGTTWLAARTYGFSGVPTVKFEISGASVTGQVLGTATPTLYGYVYKLDTTAFPNGTYTIQSVASSSGSASVTSAPVSVTISNPPLTTSVLVPSPGATLTNGSYLDAITAGGRPPISSVIFELSGNGLSDVVVGTGTGTIYGWLAAIDTTGIASGTYVLQSVATDSSGNSVSSSGVSVNITSG